MQGRLFHIQRFSLEDGPGLRTTVFLKGCPLACPWCHNPESQDPEAAVLTVASRCLHCGACVEACAEPGAPCRHCGDCVEACPAGARQRLGRDLEAADLVTELLRDRMHFEESGGGVTFSGGEPLAQSRFLVEALRGLKDRGVHTALDTCGYAPWQDLLKVASLADLVLYDVKLMDDRRHMAATGKSNGRILDNLRALAQVHSAIQLRVPVIPGCNDDEGNLEATAQLAAALPRLLGVTLLPYHGTAQAKFARLGLSYALEGLEPPSRSRMEALAERFQAHGVHVTLGGRP